MSNKQKSTEMVFVLIICALIIAVGVAFHQGKKAGALGKGNEELKKRIEVLQTEKADLVEEKKSLVEENKGLKKTIKGLKLDIEEKKHKYEKLKRLIKITYVFNMMALNIVRTELCPGPLWKKRWLWSTLVEKIKVLAGIEIKKYPGDQWIENELDTIDIWNTANFLSNGKTTNGKHIYVAVGNNGKIWTSNDDGKTWILRNSGTGANLVSVTYDAGYFKATGSDGAILVSQDGISWKRGLK